MPFPVPFVESCPIVKRTQGLIEIEPGLIKQFAGAVRDSHEWMVVLLGEKSQGGLHIIVDEIYIPSTQRREKAHVTPYRKDRPDPDEEFPEWAKRRLVGNLHSHNSMGARFSGGDRAEDGVCSTFPMSIVISSQMGNNKEFLHLGFAYEAEGQFDLPCGAMGTCSFAIVPRGIKDWPHEWEVVIPEIKEGEEHTILGDCSEYKESEKSTSYDYSRDSKCGLVETTFHTRLGVFGANGFPLLKRLPKPYDSLKDRTRKDVEIFGRTSIDLRDEYDMNRWIRESRDDWKDYLSEKYGYGILESLDK